MKLNKKNFIEKEIIKLVKIYSKNKFKNEKFIKGKSVIPASQKTIDGKEIELLVKASLDGWLTSGKFNKKFEKDIVRFLGAKLAITVNSGSSANLVAFSTLMSEKLKEDRIKEGDEIITVAAGFPTTINPIVINKCIPVFVDINLKTLNIDENLIEQAISKKTKAIMIAHTLGNPFNLKRIKEICEKNKLWLVQDTCDALGSKYEDKYVGAYGDIGTVSFYPAHHITMGEGGLVYTNSIRLKRIAESIRDWGRDCYCEPGMENTCGKRYCWKLGNLPDGYDHKYIYSHLGYNLKITDMQAACGLAQINKLEKFISVRNKNYDIYRNLFKDLEKFFFFQESTSGSSPSWFGFVLTIKDQRIKRSDLIQYLNKFNIGTRLLFAGNIIKQPYFNKIKYKISGKLNNTDYVMKNTFWVGLHPQLNHEKIKFIYSKVKEYLIVSNLI